MNRSLVRIALSTAIVLVLAVAPTALAGKGKPGGASGGGGTLGLVLLNSSDGLPHYGQQVTFNVSTTATDKPFVKLNCYQAGVHVYWASAGFFEGYPWPWTRNFTLRSSYWTGGAADCVATLYLYDGRRYKDLTSLSFHVWA
jgi:hypothetical protein